MELGSAIGLASIVLRRRSAIVSQMSDGGYEVFVNEPGVGSAWPYAC